ncbi:serine/threonine protein phosphatase [Clostridiales bacterium PH28_bin88]|nr:serine/threonine protein phosphatase [Clostridiales bacterium PH28_bin88]
MFSAKLYITIKKMRDLERHSTELAHELEHTLRREIEVARQIQSKLLNTKVPEFTGGQVTGTSISARSVGGDYYDFCMLKNGKLRIVIGDVMGKGIPAAMLMLLTRSAFRNTSEKGKGPGETLTMMNRILYDDFKSLASFVTVFCADYDPRSKVLTYANAGHNLPLIVKGMTGSCEQLQGKGIMLGGIPHQQYQEHSIQMNAADYVFFFTDGIVEARNQGGEAFRLERLRQILVQYAGSPAAEIEEKVLEGVANFTKNLPQKDDITMVILKVEDGQTKQAAV